LRKTNNKRTELLCNFVGERKTKCTKNAVFCGKSAMILKKAEEIFIKK